MQFKKLKISNFKAIGECELDLERQGFVAIRGINNTDPNTANCGTGKSSIADALHYALCNETVKGGTDVKNQYTIGDCVVAVEFEKNDKVYEIIRSKGNSLELLENGVNISGKGIRDTQNLIGQMFPEFTPEFIGATIIFGQKMPNAFTANTGSKRKEILEKLTRSDFQIEEIKERLTFKKNENAQNLRKAEDEHLANRVRLNEVAVAKQASEKEKGELALPKDLKEQTARLENEKMGYEEALKNWERQEAKEQVELDRLQKEGERCADEVRAFEKEVAEQKAKELMDAQKAKDTKVTKLRADLDLAMQASRSELAEAIQAQVQLEKELSELGSRRAIADNNKRLKEKEIEAARKELENIENSKVCPTCKRAWEEKIDTTPYINKVEQLKSELVPLIKQSVQLQEEWQKWRDELDQSRLNLKELELGVSSKESKNKEELQKLEQAENAKIAEIRSRYESDTRGKEKLEKLELLRKEYAKKREYLGEVVKGIKETKEAIKKVVEAIEKNKRLEKEYHEKSAELDKQIKLLSIREEKYTQKDTELSKEIDFCKTRAEQINKLYNFATKKFRTILLEDTIEIFEEKAKLIADKYFGVDITFKQDGATIEITYQGKQFENLSGGEECAAVLVIQTALRELLADLTGEESNVLFIDEATDGADVKLSEQIMGLIGDYNTESVFIISHHSELNLPTDKVLMVEKNNNIAEVYWG